MSPREQMVGEHGQRLRDAYWRGEMRTGPWRPLSVEDAERLAPSRPGNVSQRARQLYAAENMRHKDRVIAALYAFFLGMLGMHKFYLGYNQAAFVMMTASIIGGICTFGLAALVIWVLAIIEGAFYLSKTQTQFEEVYVTNTRDWL